MVRRIYTLILFLSSVLFIQELSAQSVGFFTIPRTLTPSPKVGDTVKVGIAVKNFSNIESFQYTHDWNPSLMEYLSVTKFSVLPDNPNLNFFTVNAATLNCNWFPGSSSATLPDSAVIYELSFKIKDTSSNYWLALSGKSTSVNVGQNGVELDGSQVFFSPLGNPPSVSPLSISSTSHQIPVSGKVCVGVLATEFTNLTKAAWSMKWDSTVIRFDSLSKLNTSLSLNATHFNTTQAIVNGRLNFNFNSTTPRTVPAADTLFKICYSAIGANNTTTTFSLSKDTIYRSADGALVSTSLIATNGTVAIKNPVVPGRLSFSATHQTGTVGDTVCVKVYAKNFKDLVYVNFSTKWDSTKLSFVRAQMTNTSLGVNSLVLPAVVDPGATYTSTPNIRFLYRPLRSGSLVFSWDDPTTNGVTFTEDSTLIFEACFKLIGAAGTSSTISFGNWPQKIEILDNAIPEPNSLCTAVDCKVDFNSGSVNINGVVTPAITLTGTKTDVTCNAGNDGKIDLTPGGGTGTFTYSWTGPTPFTASTKDIANLKAGKYYITVSSGAATPKVDSFTIAEPTKIAVSNKTITAVNCFGQSTGAVSLTVSGGTAPYTYAWSSSEATSNLTAKAAGTYILTIKDSKNCEIKDTSIITQPTAGVSISQNITNIKCNGGQDGAIALTIAGGTAPYTYSWTGPNPFTSSNKDISGLVAGDYRVTVTDSKQCAQTAGPLTITQPNPFEIGTPSVTNTGCGVSTGAISISPTNGAAPYTFSWSGPNGYTSVAQNIANLSSGSYTVVVKDANNCSFTSNPINVSSSGLTLNVVPTTKNIDCNSNANGEIALNVTGGSGNLSYAWSSPNGFTSTSKDITGLRAGSYTVIIRDMSASNCEFIPSAITITEPNALLVSTPQVTNISCKGASTGAISVSISGGTPQYSYTWSGPTGFVSINSGNLTNLTAGTYNLTITDSRGCFVQTSATVTEPAAGITFGSPSVTNVLCFNATTGSINLPVSGGTQPYTYIWKNSNGTTVGSAAILDNVGAGSYRLEARDANGCTATSSEISITQPTSAVNISENIVRANDACNGSITLTVSGGTTPYTYAWSGTGVNATAQNQVDLCPGTYSLTVTDGNGCRSTKSFNVSGTTSPPIRITDSVVTNAGCPGGTLGAISINFVGGRAPFTFAWYNQNAPNTVIAITQNITNLPSGVYYIKISDGIQSYQSGLITIKGSDAPVRVTLLGSKKETCAGNDGSIDINVTGGAAPYTYQWDKVAGNIQDLTNIQANTYSVKVKDQNNCLAEFNDILVDRILCPLVVTTTDKVDVSCKDGDNGSVRINIGNGEPGYVISWGNNNSVNVNNVPRKDGTYNITGLKAGSYDIVIRDAKDQTTTVTVVIAQPSETLVVTPTVQGDTGACSGSIRLTVTGGTQPYKYRWTDLAGTDHQRDRFDICSGKILSVEVTDSKGCKITSDNLRIPNSIPALSIDPNVVVSNASCADDFSKTKIDITVKGGLKPYKYKWSNGQEIEDISGIPAGKYRVTVTDATLPSAQSATAEYEVIAISKLKVEVTTTSATLNDGTATVTISGGTPSYTVRWCAGSAKVINDTILTEQGLAAGNCFVEVTDGLGCTKRVDFVIKSIACAEIRINTPIKCFGNKNGSATVVGVNDTTLKTPFAYRWATNESAATSIQLTGGAQAVTITGSNGKTCVANFIMTTPEEIKVDIIADNSECSLQAIVRGGTAPLKYNWTSNDTTSKIKNLKPGQNYYVIVKDANGCETQPILGKPECKEYCLQGGSVITPDGDGVNDEFKIEKCQFATVRLSVFSRWGEMVYQNQDYNNQWQGRSSDGATGKDLPEGVYFYVLRALKANGQEEITKGTVTILRPQ